MPRFPYRTPQAVLTMLALLAGPAAAQLPKPGVTPPPPAPVVHAPVTPQLPPASPLAPVPAVPPAPVTPVAGIDPQVTVLFHQAVAAHQALTALSATITSASTGAGAGTGQTITLAFQKPNKARIAVAGSTGPIVQFVSDGKTLTLYAVRDKKYRIDTIPPGANVIPAVLAQAHTLLPRLIGQPEALNELLAQPGVTANMVNDANDALGVGHTVAGVPTDTVGAALPAPDGSTVHFSFDLGKADHLLRQITQTETITQNGTAQTFLHTETVTAMVANPQFTAADFIFTPPPGVTKIAPPKPAVKKAVPLKPKAARRKA